MMTEAHPKRKVGLVTFSKSVEIIGDGTTKATSVSGSQLNDFHYILKNGVASASTFMTKPL